MRAAQRKRNKGEKSSRNTNIISSENRALQHVGNAGGGAGIRLDQLGITSALIESVHEICKEFSVFLHFPLPEDVDKFQLTARQEQHASHLLQVNASFILKFRETWIDL